MVLLTASLFCLSISGNNPHGMTCPLKQADCVWLAQAWNRTGVSKAVCLKIPRVKEEGKGK